MKSSRSPSKPLLLEGWGLAAMLSAIFIAWQLAGGARHDWRIPIAYSDDALFTLQMIKRIVEGGWFFDTSHQGHPGHSDMLDFPASDIGLYLVQKILGWLTPDAGAVLNTFFLLGFGTSAASAYWVLRRLLINPRLAFVVSVVFAAAPYHFARVEHVMLAWYFVVPLFIYQALHVLGLAPQNNDPEQRHHTHDGWWFAGAYVLGCFGVYYAFFGAMLLFVAGACAFMRKPQHGKSLKFSMGLVFVVFVAVVINVLPTIINNHLNGRNHEVATRFPNESEAAGLKIVQLVMPSADHRIRLLGKKTSHYNDDFPLVNENRFSALGILGSAGFLFLIYTLLSNQLSPGSSHPLINALALLVGATILISTIGGFSTLFALYVSPMIRAWNRVSIFIAFASLLALAIAVESRRWWHSNKQSSKVALVLLVILWVWVDQTPKEFTRQVRANRQQFLSDRQFVQQVEASLPAGSAVLELPYMFFPEGPTLHKMKTYDPGRPFLHSTTLRWSYGSIKGRQADKTVRALSEQPVDQMIVEARKTGFSGIYVDRFGYADNGQAIISKLQEQLNAKPIVSPDRRLFFIHL